MMKNRKTTPEILFEFARATDGNCQMILEALRRAEPTELGITAEELTKVRQDIRELQIKSRAIQIMADR